jgi:hypothetical protein
MIDWTATLLLVFAVVLVGCAKPPPRRRRPAEPASRVHAPEKEPESPAAGALAEKPKEPEKPEEPPEPEEPEPPPGPPGALVVHARGDVGVSVYRKGGKVAEGVAIIPIKLPPAHYTLKLHPPGLPEADLGKVTVFSEKTTDFEVTGYGELWVHSARPGEPVELFDDAGGKVASGKTCDFWLVPVGSFTVRAVGEEIRAVVESGKMTRVSAGR